MVALQLEPGVEFDTGPRSTSSSPRQPDLGVKWSPRYVRVAADLPVTATSQDPEAPAARRAVGVHGPGLVAARARRAAAPADAGRRGVDPAGSSSPAGASTVLDAS